MSDERAAFTTAHIQTDGCLRICSGRCGAHTDDGGYGNGRGEVISSVPPPGVTVVPAALTGHPSRFAKAPVRSAAIREQSKSLGDRLPWVTAADPASAPVAVQGVQGVLVASDVPTALLGELRTLHTLHRWGFIPRRSRSAGL